MKFDLEVTGDVIGQVKVRMLNGTFTDVTHG